MREVEWRMIPAKVTYDGWEEDTKVRVAAYGSPEHIKIKMQARGFLVVMEKNRLKRFLDGLE